MYTVSKSKTALAFENNVRRICEEFMFYLDEGKRIGPPTIVEGQVPNLLRDAPEFITQEFSDDIGKVLGLIKRHCYFGIDEWRVTDALPLMIAVHQGQRFPSPIKGLEKYNDEDLKPIQARHIRSSFMLDKKMHIDDIEILCSKYKVRLMAINAEAVFYMEGDDFNYLWPKSH